MPDPIYETSQIEGTPDAFQDGPILAEIARVFNNKREACGLARVDWTTIGNLFSSDSVPAAGPVSADLDTGVSVFEPGAMTIYLLALETTIPQMMDTRYQTNGTSYIWVDPDTGNPLDLPDSWDDAFLTLLEMKEPANWEKLLGAILEALNSMVEMRGLDVVSKRILNITSTVVFVKRVSTEIAPSNFAFWDFDNPPSYLPQSKTKGGERHMLVDGIELETKEIFREYALSLPSCSFSCGARIWSFRAADFSSSDYLANSFVSEGREVCTLSSTGTLRISTTTSGTRTIRISSNVINGAYASPRIVTLSCDGQSGSVSLGSPGYTSNLFTIEREVTAPYTDFSISMSLDDFTVEDLLGRKISRDVTKPVRVILPRYDTGYLARIHGALMYPPIGGYVRIGGGESAHPGFVFEAAPGYPPTENLSMSSFHNSMLDNPFSGADEPEWSGDLWAWSGSSTTFLFRLSPSDYMLEESVLDYEAEAPAVQIGITVT